MAEEKNEESGVVLGPNYPGSDPVEKAKYEIDLNFPEEITDEVLNEKEVTEEVAEETVAETEQDENETDGDITAEETTEDAEEPAESEESEETEETEETEPELEEVAELEEETEPEPKKPMVPKSRLDEVLAKQRKLQEQLDALTAEKQAPETSSEEPAPEPYDFDAKEIEYQEHVLNGEPEKAVALRKEIRAAEKIEFEREMGQKFNQHTKQSKEMDALQSAAAKMESKYPMFDQYSSDYNQELTQEVLSLRDAFMAQGTTPADSLEKAVNYVIKTNDVKSTGEETTLDAPAPKQSQDQVAKKRKEVSKKLKAAESQPPDMPGESSSAHGEKVVDISSMTDDEFNALPAATLKRLRGDIG